jgi:Domain of unknown function (DUF5348)
MNDNEQNHRLVASSNSGRFALDEANGYDLTCGQPLSIFLGGQWIDGRVEAKGQLVTLERSLPEILRDVPMRFIGGYYFIANDGHICGLCFGMTVRLR